MMDKEFIDVVGNKWVLLSYQYLENIEPGHNKFYRIAEVSGPLGPFKFTQWGRIESNIATAQCKIEKGSSTPMSMQDLIKAKRNKGYSYANDFALDDKAWLSRAIWQKIYRAVQAEANGATDTTPLWVYEYVPQDQAAQQL